jgi:hypothetical protein
MLSPSITEENVATLTSPSQKFQPFSLRPKKGKNPAPAPAPAVFYQDSATQTDMEPTGEQYEGMEIDLAEDSPVLWRLERGGTTPYRARRARGTPAPQKTSTCFQTLSLEEVEFGILREKMKALVVVAWFGSAREEAGVGMFVEPVDERIAHSEQFRLNITFDADGHGYAKAMTAPLLPNILSYEAGTPEGEAIRESYREKE